MQVFFKGSAGLLGHTYVFSIGSMCMLVWSNI